jgi:hypothetical protein
MSRTLLFTAAASLLVPAALHSQQTDPAKPKAEPAKPAAAATPAPAPAAAPAVAPVGISLKSRQSTLYGLLVMEIGQGKLAGQAQQMNCTATQQGSEPAVLKFNQAVGKQMEGALNEVHKFMEVRHNGWPKGYVIEMSFEDRYVPKDGPSAACACALLVDSLFTGTPLMDKTAVTGDITATGAVQPVGGVPDKLRGAASKGCTVACIPIKNARSMADHALIKGPRPLTAIQIFVAEKFDDAKKVTSNPRDPGVEKAIAEFSEIARVLNANANPALAVKHPKVVEKLRSVLKNAPNHLSAKLLLEMAEGRSNKALSAAGSLEAINSESEALVEGLRSGASPDKLGKDKVADAVMRLNNIRSRLDKRTFAYADSLLDFGRAFRQYTTGDQPDTRSEVIKAIEDLKMKQARVGAEWEKLRGDQALMETVMDQ